MAGRANVNDVYENRIKGKFHFNFELKDEQVVESILRGNHTVGVFPTGFGKSVCYLLPPLILDEIEKSHQICIVISHIVHVVQLYQLVIQGENLVSCYRDLCSNLLYMLCILTIKYVQTKIL